MKTWLKILIGLFVLGIIAFFVVYKFVYNKPHPDYETMNADYTLGARDIYQAFRDSRDAATRQYNGKVIEITGKLSKIEASDSLVVAVFVFNQGMFGDEGVRCTMLKKFNDGAKKLQPDGDVRVKGYCTGFNDTDVILEKCSIITQ
jgi:hypothetical protein